MVFFHLFFFLLYTLYIHWHARATRTSERKGLLTIFEVKLINSRWQDVYCPHTCSKSSRSTLKKKYLWNHRRTQYCSGLFDYFNKALCGCCRGSFTTLYSPVCCFFLLMPSAWSLYHDQAVLQLLFHTWGDLFSLNLIVLCLFKPLLLAFCFWLASQPWPLLCYFYVD